ncbi:MAG: hydrolase [Actinobacteria bacterium 13_2_20CM_2_71_6]|nr:MAG: hydrolase [Actinobacteria bacterium 13_2_20CM_2_71_6]
MAAPAHAVPATQLVLPDPTGHERIGTVSLHLVDRSRPDPWVTTDPVREIMVQIWYPATDVRAYPRAPWVSPGVAARLIPPGSQVILPTTHAHVGAPVDEGRHPVVLYSPGLGLERTSSTSLVEDLASHGYIVVTIDHTHDARFVEFPNGRIETSAIPEPADPADGERIITKALGVRVADTRFVLDQLAAINRGSDPDAERRPMPRGLAGALDLSRVGMFGHSLGGAAAAETMYEDARVKAGLDLDGTLSGPVVTAGLDRPFLLMGSPGGDDSWTALWAHLRGPRLELHLAGSGHLSFTDLQVLLPQAGVPPEAMVPSFGTIEGQRAVTVQRAYVRAFFDRYLCHGSGKLLAGPSPRYPEMRFGS